MIEVTERAAQEVQRVMQEQKMEEGKFMLRVAVEGGGCSGFQYKLTFEEKEKIDDATDIVNEFHGLKVAVDMKSDLYLDGTTIDFYEGLERRGFTFNNPNSKGCCGCGASFRA